MRLHHNGTPGRSNGAVPLLVLCGDGVIVTALHSCHKQRQPGNETDGAPLDLRRVRRVPLGALIGAPLHLALRSRGLEIEIVENFGVPRKMQSPRSRAIKRISIQLRQNRGSIICCAGPLLSTCAEKTANASDVVTIIDNTIRKV